MKKGSTERWTINVCFLCGDFIFFTIFSFCQCSAFVLEETWSLQIWSQRLLTFAPLNFVAHKDIQPFRRAGRVPECAVLLESKRFMLSNKLLWMRLSEWPMCPNSHLQPLLHQQVACFLPQSAFLTAKTGRLGISQKFLPRLQIFVW